MLKGHKYFHPTTFQDKTDAPKKPQYTIFGPFLTIFGHFYQKGIFLKKSGCDVHLQMWP